MQSPLFPVYFLVLILFFHSSRAIAQDDAATSFHSKERDALYALKALFNNPILNAEWNGLQCNGTQNGYGIQCVNGRVTGIELESIGLIGNINLNALSNLTELSMLSFKNNSITGGMMDFSFNKKLKQLDLSANFFDGPISSSLLSLDLLQSLQLQDNFFSGIIPEFDQSSLTLFNVSNNNLIGSIPITEKLQSFSYDSYTHNPDLCGTPSPIPCNPSMRDTADSSNDNKESIWSRFRVLFILMDILGVIAIVCLVTLFCKRFRWLKRMENKDGIEEIKDEKDETFTEEVNGNGQRKLIFLEGEPFFELGDLLKASAEGLGKGTSGNSYKAKLDEGKAVVVKRLRDLKPLSSEEFVKQLLTIAEQKHPNLLPILAYYYSKEEKLVVYKYAENGNLYNRIHGGRGKGRIPFRWNARLSVARGVARALQYLHHNAKSQTIVPHGNLKSSNILLNENNMVLVSDYGLTSLIAFPIAAQRMVAYKSPEYQSTRKVSIKSDIWSYGSLLLELLTGKVPAHSAPPGVIGVDLCSWVHRAVREEWTAEIFDLELSSQRNASQGMVKLLQIAIKCCNKSTEKRPQIAEIVREVESVRANDSEDEDDLSSERSLTDESQSLSASGGIKISE